MHAWLGNFVSEIPCGRPVAVRFYERALPEMLHFRDSREIMYEVPLFLLPFRRSLSICIPLRLCRFPYGKSRFAMYNSAGRRKGKKERQRTSRTDKQSSENEPRKSAATDFLPYFFLFRRYLSFSRVSSVFSLFVFYLPFTDHRINYRQSVVAITKLQK